jgi:hypothetical protein
MEVAASLARGRPTHARGLEELLHFAGAKGEDCPLPADRIYGAVGASVMFPSS